MKKFHSQVACISIGKNALKTKFNIKPWESQAGSQFSLFNHGFLHRCNEEIDDFFF